MTHVLLWSKRHNTLGIETFEHMLTANREAYRDNREVERVPLLVGDLQLLEDTLVALRGTLQKRVGLRREALPTSPARAFSEPTR